MCFQYNEVTNKSAKFLERQNQKLSYQAVKSLHMKYLVTNFIKQGCLRKCGNIRRHMTPFVLLCSITKGESRITD